MPGTPDTPDDTSDVPASAAPPIILLSFDYGRRRIGVAVGQAVTGSANPIGTARNSNTGPDWTRIGSWIEEWQPAKLVVGLPLLADGTESDMTRAARAFGRELERFGLPVDWVDERYTSIEAGNQLREARAGGRRGRIRKEHVDAAAAVMIAERWLGENS